MDKQGRWEEHEFDWGRKYYRCSECGHDTDVYLKADTVILPEKCPNCQAEMEE